ncbi:TRAP transporter small permease [Ruegeria arenilitoris]|uniref:TRAP transporter small permease n=1 Tax=Ruegeria arenilitoris TaxID=1173585 RepID=UPI0020C5A52B|nr:TRAP transporter small permease subunit [Ruegeria arenilitoris]
MPFLQSVFRNVAAAILLVVVILNFSNVMLRYVFGQSLIWAEEVLIYSNIWVVAVAAVAVTVDRGHLTIDVLGQATDSRWRRVLAFLSDGIVLAVSLGAVTASLAAIKIFLYSSQSSVSAKIPMWLPHSAFLVCFSAIAGISAYGLIQLVRRGANSR